MEKLITSIQSQCSHRKKFLWKRRALKKMDQPCQKAAPLIYWRSVVFPVFFSLLLFCVESHIVLARLSITKPSFPGRAAQTYHSLLMQFWCQSEVVFWMYLKKLLLEREKSARFALPLQFYYEDIEFFNVFNGCRSGHLLSQKVYLCSSWQSDQPWHALRTILPASIFDQLIPYNNCTEIMSIM